MNKSLLKKISIEAVYVLIQLVLSRISLFGFLSPAGLPFAFLRLFAGGNIFVVIAAYAVSKIYTFFTLPGLLIAVYEIVFLALYYFAKEFLKFKHKWLLNIIFVSLSNVLYLYYSMTTLVNLGYFAISLFCQILLDLFFLKFLSTLKSKFVFFKFSNTDYLVFSVMTFLLSLGLFSFEYIEPYVGLFFLMFPAMFLCKVLPPEKYFTAIITLAVGSLLATYNDFYLIIVTISSVIFLEFKSLGKYIYISICTAVLTIFVFIFNIFGIFQIISLVFAILLLIAIPNKIVAKISFLFEADSLSITMSHIEEQKLFDIKSKLMLMSDTFKDMQKSFKYLIVGKINREQASIELAGDVISKCCSGCENFKSCFFENINKRAMFENLLNRAIENNQIEVNDLTNGVEAYCSKSSIVVSEINQTAKLFHEYETAVKSEDLSKLVIASELENFSDIFSCLSNNLNASLFVNDRLSKVLKERLTCGLIDVKEIIIAENKNGIESINAILPNEQVAKREVAEIISKVTKVGVRAESVKHLELSGLSLATFLPLPKLRINFAISSKSKEAKNGDSGIVTKLSNTKYFIAIADGMGHGEKANKISSMVLSLIKSMFEVGLDDTLILQSINKLLLPAGLENFTTLDACVIDLETQQANFIKLGSSVSILKHANTSEIIASDSLPIGIVKNLKPTIVKKPIVAGDMIFIASDGVVDSFPNINQFKNFVNDSKIYNMQKYLDDVISDAEAENTTHIDDMTIIGINLLKN